MFDDIDFQQTNESRQRQASGIKRQKHLERMPEIRLG
jgi:hypothetical protein